MDSDPRTTASKRRSGTLCTSGPHSVPNVPAEAFLKAASSTHSRHTNDSEPAGNGSAALQVMCASTFPNEFTFSNFCRGLESGNPKQSPSTMYTSTLCPQRRPTSSLCACGAACTISWLRLSFLVIYCCVGRYRARLGTRKRSTHASSNTSRDKKACVFTTSTCLKHSRDGKVCVFTTSACLIHSRDGKACVFTASAC